MFETIGLTIIVITAFTILGCLILFVVIKSIQNRREQMMRLASEFNLSLDEESHEGDSLLPGAKASQQINIMRGIINGHEIIIFDEFNMGNMHSAGQRWTVLAIDGNAHRVKHFLFGTQFVPIVYLRRELSVIK